LKEESGFKLGCLNYFTPSWLSTWVEVAIFNKNHDSFAAGQLDRKKQ
jgi:hypothetical protein